MLQPVNLFHFGYRPYQYRQNHSHSLKAYESREDMETRLREERSEIQDSINDNDSKQRDCSNRISTLESRVRDDQSAIDSDKSDINKNEQDYENKKSELEEALSSDEDKLKDDQNDLDDARSELSDLKDTHDDLERRLNNVR